MRKSMTLGNNRTLNNGTPGATGRRLSQRLGRRLGLMLALMGLALSVAACGAVGSDDEAQDAVSSSSRGEAGGVAMGGFPEGAPAPSSPQTMPSGAGTDGSFSSNGPVAPQEEAAPGLTNTLGRVVIRNGQIELVVESVEDSFQQVRQITESTGGYVSGSTLTGREETQRAYLTLRIPADDFDNVVERLRGLAIEVHSASTSSQDVTEEYAIFEYRGGSRGFESTMS